MSGESEYKAVRQAVYFIRSMHKKPSADKVINAMRAIGAEAPHKSRVCVHMKQLFADEESKQNQIGTILEPQIELKRTTDEPVQNTGADQDNRLLDKKTTSSSPAAQMQLVNEAPKTTKAKKEPSVEDLAVRGLLAALLPHISPLIAGAMTQAKWKQCNARAARDMVQAGITPEQCVEKWQQCRAYDGRKFYMLDGLQKEIVKRGLEQAAPTRAIPNAMDRLAARVYGHVA